jgi:ribosomal protein S18 acetylase RimI-like enzyme
MEDVRIDEGFSEDERDHVAALYWEAFGRKLRPGFVDEPTGRAVVRAALRSDHLLVARRSGQVVGVCGYYEDGTGAADLRWSRLRGALVLDGICVDPAARGRGIGTALLGAASDKARRIGARVVRLSVIGTNPRARALYERHGFTPAGHGSLGPLSPVYGFDGYTTMELEVSR